QQHKLSLRDVTLDSDLLALQAQLAVTLAAPYPLTSDLQWQWLQSLPSNLTTPAQSNSQAHAEGTLHLAGDLNNLLVSHQLRTPLLMNSDGNVVLDLFAQDSGRSQVFSVMHQVPAQ